MYGLKGFRVHCLLWQANPNLSTLNPEPCPPCTGLLVDDAKAAFEIAVANGAIPKQEPVTLTGEDLGGGWGVVCSAQGH